jgi:hypothetical protein
LVFLVYILPLICIHIFFPSYVPRTHKFFPMICIHLFVCRSDKMIYQLCVVNQSFLVQEQNYKLVLQKLTNRQVE